MDAHDLYGLPLERFVPERTALAKALRKTGQREQAEAVAALRKPSLAAWAVNQLVRTQSRAVAELHEAGDAARAAQAELLSGRGDTGALRDGLARERQAVRQLVEVARGLLTSEGHGLSPATLERVADTLHAAALDEESRTRTGEGCLDRELRHVGLGDVAGTAAPRQRAPRPPRAGRAHQSRSPARATPLPQRAKPAAPTRDMSALRRAETAARRGVQQAAKQLSTAR